MSANTFTFKFIAFAVLMVGITSTAPGETDLQAPQSPYEMARELERNLASFSGLLMPDTNLVYICYMGVLPLPDAASTNAFPEVFTSGLAPVEEFGIETFPVAARVDDDSGVTVFYNATNTVFWRESPYGVYEPDWILQLLGDGPHSPWLEEVLRPSHVEARWVFVARENVEAYHAARLESLRGAPAGAAPSWGESGLPELRITEFILAEDSYYFASAWNRIAYFPLKKINVLFAPDLRSPQWTVVRTVAVSNNSAGRTAFFEVPRMNVPDIPFESFAHDEYCLPTTNFVISPLDPGVTYTNAVCACAGGGASPSGFFRLNIPDPSINIPAWWRVLHGFAPYDSWEDGVDFNNTGFSNVDKYEQGLSPVAPPESSNSSAATIQYNYDTDDRLTAAFIGADGDAAIRHLSPAGNPAVQQERSAK